MIVIKSALIYSDGYCLGQLNQIAPGPYFRQRATPSRRTVQWTSTVPYFSFTRLMQSPLLSLADNAVCGETKIQTRVIEPHVALLCRSAQTSAQRFEFCPNEAWSNEDHQFLEKTVRSLCFAKITAETKGGSVERATSSERVKLKPLRSLLLNETSGLKTFDEPRD